MKPINFYSPIPTPYSLIPLLLSLLLFSCSNVTKNSDGTVTTEYGFNLTDVIDANGSPDSMLVMVTFDGEPQDTLHFTAADLDGTILRFPVVATENREIRISYVVYANGTAVASNTQTFVSGDNPKVPRPNLAPTVNMATDTLRLARDTEWRPVYTATGYEGKLAKENTLAMIWWDFDGDKIWDDSSAQADIFRKRYDSVGTYGAKVRVRDLQGIEAIDSIQITVVAQAPLLMLRFDETASIGDTLHARLTYSFDTPASALGAKIQWNYDGKMDTTNADTLRTFIAGTPGKHPLHIALVDSYGTATLDSGEVTVVLDAPVVNAGAGASGFVGTPIAFVGTSTQSFGKIVQMGWDFDGDTTGGKWDSVFTSENLVILYTYAEQGNFSARFYALDDDGNKTIGVRPMSIGRNSSIQLHVPDLQQWSASDTVITIKDSVVFAIQQKTDAAGPSDILHYKWDFNGDGIWELDNPLSGNTDYRYATAGTYKVFLKLVDSQGDSDIDSLTVHVLQGVPVVSADTAITNGSANSAITFSGIATDPNGEGNLNALMGSIASVKWDYNGDGTFDRTSATNTGFSYTYGDLKADSTYTAKFCATDNDANEACATRSVRIVNHAPVLGASAINVSQTPVSITKPSVLKVNATDFTDADANQVDSITWSFSDGATARKLGRNDTLWLVRATAATVTVTATVKDKYGLTASRSTDVVVSTGTINVTGTGDIVSVINAQVALNPAVTFTLAGQTLASCRWSINGAGFGSASATCANTITMPGSPYSDYTAAFEATSDVGTQTTGTIHILVRDGFIDPRDGQGYATVTIDGNVWMAQNLNYSGGTGGVRAYTTGWCYGVGATDTTKHQDSTTCDGGYGRLYDWTTVMAGSASSTANPSGVRGLCPVGWHVPSDAEWTALTTFAGGESVAGTKLKTTTGWQTNTGTDFYGFSALPAGNRIHGGWNDRTDFAYFWSATEFDGTLAWFRYLVYYSANVVRYGSYGPKDDGYAVRCSQD
jgi:uncharacterized protein (TIGR02145 family)